MAQIRQFPIEDRKARIISTFERLGFKLVREGDYVWRPKGNRHLARSPNGALVLSFFLKPNKFF